MSVSKKEESPAKQLLRTQEFVRDLKRILDARLPHDLSQNEQLKRRIEKRTWGKRQDTSTNEDSGSICRVCDKPYKDCEHGL